jgi:hypothetical protein
MCSCPSLPQLIKNMWSQDCCRPGRAAVSVLTCPIHHGEPQLPTVHSMVSLTCWAVGVVGQRLQVPHGRTVVLQGHVGVRTALQANGARGW